MHERLGGREDIDSSIAGEHLQIGIARDDGIGARGRRAGKHRGVIGIAKTRLPDGRGVDQLREFKIAREYFLCAQPLAFELGGKFRPTKQSCQFGKQGSGGEQLDGTLAGGRDQPLGVPAPEQRRDHDVGVKNEAHGPREAPRARLSVPRQVPPR